MLSDLRQDLYKKTFPRGLIYDDYVTSGDASQRDRWTARAENIKLSPQQVNTIQNYTRKMNIFVLSGIWCGDCLRQGPIVANLAKINPLIECRFFDNGEFPELREELRILGGTRVPVVLICSEDFFEVCRYGDKTYSTYLKKFSQESGPACATGFSTAEEDSSQEINEWFEVIDRAQKMLRLSSNLRGRYKD